MTRCMKISTLILLITLSVSALSSSSFAAQSSDTLITRDGTKLSAVWDISTDQPTKVAIVVPGSGAKVGLDGDVSSPLIGSGYKGGSTKLSDQTAAMLVSKGLNVFRFAKRGVDDATQLTKQTLPYLKPDLVDAIQFVRARYPLAKIALVGFSEGALLSVLVTAEGAPIDALHLLGLPTRAIDDVFSYQFVEWPVELLRRKADSDHNGVIDATERKVAPVMPYLGDKSWDLIDADHDGNIDIASELVRAYEAFYGQIRGLLTTPEFKDWYAGMKTVPRIEDVAKQITAPVYLYHGVDDAQVNWNWILSDKRYFKSLKAIRLYNGLGHCFAPMDGAIGEVKTSGPFDQSMLEQLATDLL